MNFGFQHRRKLFGVAELSQLHNLFVVSLHANKNLNPSTAYVRLSVNSIQSFYFIGIPRLFQMLTKMIFCRFDCIQLLVILWTAVDNISSMSGRFLFQPQFYSINFAMRLMCVTVHNHSMTVSEGILISVYQNSKNGDEKCAVYCECFYVICKKKDSTVETSIH